MNKNIFIFLCIFLIILLINIPTLNLPSSEDSAGYVMFTTMRIYENNLNIFDGNPHIHLPFFTLLLAFLYKIFGPSLIVGRILIIFFSALAILFTYLLAKELYNKETGIIASLLLFFSSLFIAVSGIVIMDMPFTALLLMTFYFLFKKNNWGFFLSSIFLILIKETGVLIYPAIVYYLYKTNENNNLFIKKCILYCLPVLIFVFWSFYNKIYFDWFTSPVISYFKTDSLSKIFLNFIKILKYNLFNSFNWIITSLIILSPLRYIKFKEKTKRIYLFLVISGLFFIIFSMIKLLISPLQIYFTNVEEHINDIYNFRFFITILFLFILLSYKEFFKLWNKLETKTILIFILIFMVFLSFYNASSYRYFLPLYSLIFIFGSRAIQCLFGNNKIKYFLVIIIIIISISIWMPEKPYHGDLSANLEYINEIKTNKEALNYIEINYPNSTILVPDNYFVRFQLEQSYLGYVTKPLKYITISDNVSEDQFDIFYYFGFMDSSEKQKIIEKYNLKIEKIFKCRGKFTEIYTK